jgi:hypothetical protein
MQIKEEAEQDCHAHQGRDAADCHAWGRSARDLQKKTEKKKNEIFYSACQLRSHLRPAYDLQHSTVCRSARLPPAFIAHLPGTWGAHPPLASFSLQHSITQWELVGNLRGLDVSWWELYVTHGNWRGSDGNFWGTWWELDGSWCNLREFDGNNKNPTPLFKR